MGRPNNSMQRTALRAAADAERYAVERFRVLLKATWWEVLAK
jgi:hypothetical protein